MMTGCLSYPTFRRPDIVGLIWLGYWGGRAQKLGQRGVLHHRHPINSTVLVKDVGGDAPHQAYVGVIPQ